MTKSWLFRLYVLLSIGWAAWFGSQAYDANRQIEHAAGYIQIAEYDRRMGNASAYSLAELVAWQTGQLARFNSTIRTIAEGLAVGTIAFLLFRWISQRPKRQIVTGDKSAFEKRTEEIRYDRQTWRFKPASTALLVISVLLFPRIWMIDATSVSLYWVARLPRY